MNWSTWIYRKLFYCKRKLCPHVKREMPTVPSSKLPWFWIGVKTSEEVICVTDIINNNVKYGTRVTSKLLNELTDITDKNAVWKYVDAKTLEEKEFPPEGIVIDDDALCQPVFNT